MAQDRHHRLGKIAQDQHVPVIRENPDFALVAVSSQRGMSLEGVPHAFTDYREMLRLAGSRRGRDLHAAPGPPRHSPRGARRGKACAPREAACGHLERTRRPEGRRRTRASRVLFTTWHSQYNRGVEEARQALLGETVKRLLVNWKEDVRHWHPGQQWIWEAGGFGVFDPGINALSIVTRIMPAAALRQAARSCHYPGKPRGADRGGSRLHVEAGGGGSARGLRLAPDRSAKLGHRDRDGIGQEAQARRRRQPPRNRRPGRRVDEKPAEYEAIYERFATLL